MFLVLYSHFSICLIFLNFVCIFIFDPDPNPNRNRNALRFRFPSNKNIRFRFHNTVLRNPSPPLYNGNTVEIFVKLPKSSKGAKKH
jgi:hypothetical protein